MSKSKPEIDDEFIRSATQFFFIISRFEYALKRCGFMRPRNDKSIKVDWDAYAASLGKGFFQSMNESGRIDYLINTPPKKQVIENGTLDWVDVPKISNVQELFAGVCRVRNNLFHGGKFPVGHIEEPGRNIKLLEQAEAVLRYTLEHSPQVRNWFNKPI